ncbi:MAG: hypothetical protein JWM68_4941 [Verrucomicrobiales bacterium]|nr:hypothetical protein [Verrucomicrobiales bacterium]
MASLFRAQWRELNLLDAGAGTGALSAALIQRICSARHKPKRISVTAYEVDSSVIEKLRETLDECGRACERVGIPYSATVLNQDFIEAAIPMLRRDLFSSQSPVFNAAIANPPYRKIRSDSNSRLLLRSAGIETSNLYTAFLALITRLLAPDAELVAITPRSFCNGPYFKPFRVDFIQTMALQRLHVFNSRSAAFSKDKVLQENIILHATKTAVKPQDLVVSSSSGEAESEIKERSVAYSDVISPKDLNQFIHLISDESHVPARSVMNSLSASLKDLGLSVSTGRVVDFRAKSSLRQQPEKGTAPLIYPCHFNGGFVHWPKEKCRKPNAIVSDEQTKSLLVPTGIYVLVKRFTSKEERRRVVACIFDPTKIPGPLVGFENHLNYFHLEGRGLAMSLAKGLAAFLNSSVLDNYFRQFNGHTQVNATDLRSLNYPTRAQLERIGSKVNVGADQQTLDEHVQKELNG